MMKLMGLGQNSACHIASISLPHSISQHLPGPVTDDSLFAVLHSPDPGALCATTSRSEWMISIGESC
jgi:hypothetical protein